MFDRIQIWLVRTFSLLFFFILLVETCGCYLLPSMYQMVIRYSVHQKIWNNAGKQTVRTIRIPVDKKARSVSSFVMQGDDECWFEGKLYDILRVRRTRDTLIYYGVFDEKETSVAAWIQSMIKQKFSPNQEGPVNYFILYILTLFCNLLLILSFIPTVSKWVFNRMTSKNYRIYIFPLIPPPKEHPAAFLTF
jgi:hypothetical protein